MRRSAMLLSKHCYEVLQQSRCDAHLSVYDSDARYAVRAHNSRRICQLLLWLAFNSPGQRKSSYYGYHSTHTEKEFSCSQ